MKFTTVFLILSLALVYSCKDTPTRPGAILDENYEPITPQGTTATPPPATAEPAQNAQGVWHYTCPNNCAGGGGSATPCGVCGTTLVHNQAYHAATGGTAPTNNTVTNPNGAPVGSITNPVVNGVGAPAAAPMINPGAAPTAAATKTPEPAQNAAGVWHYTCSAGCAGGAGSAIACAGCGATLAHNAAYHN